MRLAGTGDDYQERKNFLLNPDQEYVESIEEQTNIYRTQFSKSFNSFVAYELQEKYESLDIDEATDICIKHHVICSLYNNRNERVCDIDQNGNRNIYM